MQTQLDVADRLRGDVVGDQPQVAGLVAGDDGRGLNAGVTSQRRRGSGGLSGGPVGVGKRTPAPGPASAPGAPPGGALTANDKCVARQYRACIGGAKQRLQV